MRHVDDIKKNKMFKKISDNDIPIDINEADEIYEVNIDVDEPKLEVVQNFIGDETKLTNLTNISANNGIPYPYPIIDEPTHNPT